MIYITGDTHANQTKWVRELEPMLSAGDLLIVAGDFGIGFWNGRYWSEELFFDHIAEQPYTVAFLDGNHENFDKLNVCPVGQWNGGRVHFLRPNLVHLMRGEVYDLEGSSVFVFGGGYSMDRYRRVPGESWWPQEMPTEDEYENGRRNLERVGHRVDCILTHTAPTETVYYLSTLRSLGIHGNVMEERPLTAFLDEVQHGTSYERWYFGHFHIDLELWRGQTAMLSTLRELKTGKVRHQWVPYEG